MAFSFEGPILQPYVEASVDGLNVYDDGGIWAYPFHHMSRNNIPYIPPNSQAASPGYSYVPTTSSFFPSQDPSAMPAYLVGGEGLKLHLGTPGDCQTWASMEYDQSPLSEISQDTALLLSPCSSPEATEHRTGMTTDCEQSMSPPVAEVISETNSDSSTKRKKVRQPGRRNGKPKPEKQTAQQPERQPAKSKPKKKKRKAAQKALALERNREAATRYRQRRQEKAAYFTSCQERLDERRKELTSTVEALQAEICRLKGRLLQHTDCDCVMIHDYIANEAKKFVKTVSEGNKPCPSCVAMNSALHHDAPTGQAVDCDGKTGNEHHPEPVDFAYS